MVTGGVTMTTSHELLRDLRMPTRDLRRAVPGVYAGFGEMHDAAFADGALPSRTKELVALVISVVKGCEACIAYHARAVATLGATEAEVAEALGVAVVMDGGPAASGYGPLAFRAFQEFAAEQQAKSA